MAERQQLVERTIEREVLLAERDDRRRGVAEEEAEERGADEERGAAGPQRQPDERDRCEAAERAAQHHERGREAQCEEDGHEAARGEHALRATASVNTEHEQNWCSSRTHSFSYCSCANLCSSPFEVCE